MAAISRLGDLIREALAEAAGLQEDFTWDSGDSPRRETAGLGIVVRRLQDAQARVEVMEGRSDG